MINPFACIGEGVNYCENETLFIPLMVYQPTAWHTIHL